MFVFSNCVLFRRDRAGVWRGWGNVATAPAFGRLARFRALRSTAVEEPQLEPEGRPALDSCGATARAS